MLGRQNRDPCYNPRATETEIVQYMVLYGMPIKFRLIHEMLGLLKSLQGIQLRTHDPISFEGVVGR